MVMIMIMMAMMDVIMMVVLTADAGHYGDDDNGNGDDGCDLRLRNTLNSRLMQVLMQVKQVQKSSLN